MEPFINEDEEDLQGEDKINFFKEVKKFEDNHKKFNRKPEQYEAQLKELKNKFLENHNKNRREKCDRKEKEYFPKLIDTVN